MQSGTWTLYTAGHRLQPETLRSKFKRALQVTENTSVGQMWPRAVNLQTLIPLGLFKGSTWITRLKGNRHAQRSSGWVGTEKWQLGQLSGQRSCPMFAVLSSCSPSPRLLSLSLCDLPPPCLIYCRDLHIYTWPPPLLNASPTSSGMKKICSFFQRATPRRPCWNSNLGMR